MTTNQTVIHFGTVLLSVFVLVQGILFGGPSGELLPNNPQKCTGENITFTCKANGHNSSRLKFKLNDNGSLPDSATVIIDDSTRSMTLTDLTMGEHHLNILCCMNDCNKSSDIVGSTQLLRMYEYPTSVVNFSCVRFGWSNEMSCTFDLGQVYRELPTVVVRWRMRALSGSWNDCPDFDKVSKSGCKWHNQSVSDRHIDIEIGITSQCGISVPEQRFEVNTSLIVKPYPLPEIRVLAVNSTCIQAVWDNPVFNQLKQYRIEISSHWTESGSEEIEPYYEVESMDTRKNESSYTFCDLVPNTVYTVTGYIKPAVEGYWSEVKVAPEVTTPKDIPFNSPNITEGAYKWDPAQCEADGKRTIYLYFNSISKRYQNGEMKATVARGDKPFRHLELTNKTEIPADHTQLGVEVNCDTDYNFLISGRNEIGDSDIVSKIFVPKASPGLKVPKLVIETLEQKIYLHWSAEISKMVTGFTLFWCKKYRGNCQMDAVIHWKKLPADNDTAVLEISSPEDYLYSVSMETQQGSTGMTWESCIYARYAVPQKHPETPTVSRSSEDNTLAVYWNKMECESGSPYIVSYKVIYCIWAKNANNCSGERSELIVPSTKTSVVLEDLKEDQEYGVIIQGLTADGQESPLSDPAFGTPVNNSLETGSIVGIAIGCAFAFLIMLAGIIAIIRCCRKKVEKRFGQYQIEDVLAKRTSDTHSNGYSNQVCSGYELPNGVTGGTENYRELDPVPNGTVPHLPPRTERQLSKDSGIPDDPLTPRNTDERMQFPSTIDEQKPVTPVTPDGNFDLKWHTLPNGYTRVKTDEDNIPRICDLNSSTDTGLGGYTLPKHTIAPRNLMESPYVPNGPVGSLPIVPQPSLIVMTAFQPQNQATIPRPEARDVNTAEAEESGQSPVTSYLKATLVHTEEVNYKDKARSLNDEKNARIPEELVTNKKMITETVIVPIMREANQQSSDYLPNDITAIGNTDNSPKRLANDTDRYVPHGNAQNADTTGYLLHSQMGTSDPENSMSHLDPMDILVTSNVNTHDIVSGSEMQHADTAIYNIQSCITTFKSPSGSSRPNSVDTLVATTVNPGGYVSQSEMHHANTNSYYPHCNSPAPNSDNSRSQKSSVATSSNNGSYVSHSEMHPANTTGYVSDDNIAIPNPGNSRSHPNSLATPTNTGGYVSQSEMLPTKTTGYLPHNNTASSDSGNTRSHPEYAATPGNTDGYISHSQMQAVNNTDYVSQAGNIGTPSSDNSRSHPHAFATLNNTGGYVSQSEMQSANTTDNVSKGNIPAPSSCSNRSLADSVASPSNTGSYISHSQIHASNTTDYVPQGNIASPNFDNNRSHSDSVATPVKLDSYLSQSEMQPNDTNGYVLHDNIATSNSGNSGSHQDSVATIANIGGYVSQSEVEPVSTTDYVSHDSVATPNSGNNRLHSNSVATPANTDGCVSHSEIQLPNTTDYVSLGNIATPIFDNTHSDSVATPVKMDSYLSQSEMHSNNTNDYVSHGNIATSNSGNSGSHSESVATLAHTGGYVSQSEVQPASTTDYVLHDSVATLNSGNNRLHSSSVTTPTNTVDYVSHSGMQPPDTTDYVSKAKIATLNSGNSRSHPNSVDRLADSDITSENETNTNTIGYICHEMAQSAGINHPISNSYIKTSNSDTNMSHANAVVSVPGCHIQLANAELASTGTYLPHTDAVKSSGYESQSNLATNNVSGYVSLENMANPHPDISPCHRTSAVVNTLDCVLNDSIHVPNTEIDVLVPHENTIGAKTGDYVSVNGNSLASEEVPINSNDINDTDNKIIDKTVVSYEKELKKNEDDIVERSGNRWSSGLHVRTNSLSDHGEILKTCIDSSDSANYIHSGSDNCDIQSASAALKTIKSDYISHDSAIIQNGLKPEETVNKKLKDENKNPLSEDVSVISEQNDLNSKCLEDKSNNNVTENLNETATGSNNLRRTPDKNDRKIIPNANGYVGLDQLQKVSAGQGTVKSVNGYITADQMQNLQNQNFLE